MNQFVFFLWLWRREEYKQQQHYYKMIAIFESKSKIAPSAAAQDAEAREII